MEKKFKVYRFITVVVVYINTMKMNFLSKGLTGKVLIFNKFTSQQRESFYLSASLDFDVYPRRILLVYNHAD